MSIVVTGTSGYIGRAVAQELTRRSIEVLGVGRTDPGLPGVEHLTWDITERPPAHVRRRAGLVSAVVHCAGLAGELDDEDVLYATNVTGTRHVLDAFPSSRFVHMSSTAVYDPRIDHSFVAEDAAPLPTDRYPSTLAVTKAEAETMMKRVRPDAIILRPHTVYGPGSPQIMRFVETVSRKNKLKLPNGGHKQVQLTSITNLVSAACHALHAPSASGAINVADPEPYSLTDALTVLMARAGKPPLEYDFVPGDLALIRARRAEKKAAKKYRRGKDVGVPWSPSIVRNMIHERTYSLDRLERLLGFVPRRDIIGRA